LAVFIKNVVKPSNQTPSKTFTQTNLHTFYYRCVWYSAEFSAIKTGIYNLQSTLYTTCLQCVGICWLSWTVLQCLARGRMAYPGEHHLFTKCCYVTKRKPS